MFMTCLDQSMANSLVTGDGVKGASLQGFCCSQARMGVKFTTDSLRIADSLRTFLNKERFDHLQPINNIRFRENLSRAMLKKPEHP